MRIMKSRENLSISSCLGKDSDPANFGCNPESITNLKGPISQRLQFAPIPPCAFKSVNFMNARGRYCPLREYPSGKVSFECEYGFGIHPLHGKNQMPQLKDGLHDSYCKRMFLLEGFWVIPHNLFAFYYCLGSIIIGQYPFPS